MELRQWLRLERRGNGSTATVNWNPRQHWLSMGERAEGTLREVDSGVLPKDRCTGSSWQRGCVFAKAPELPACLLSHYFGPRPSTVTDQTDDRPQVLKGVSISVSPSTSWLFSWGAAV